jgi:hypothetical protein
MIEQLRCSLKTNNYLRLVRLTCLTEVGADSFAFRLALVVAVSAAVFFATAAVRARRLEPIISFEGGASDWRRTHIISSIRASNEVRFWAVTNGSHHDIHMTTRK